jgi:hypothetical protein
MDELGRYESNVLSSYALPYQIMGLTVIAFDKNIVKGREKPCHIKIRIFWAEKARRKLSM